MAHARIIKWVNKIRREHFGKGPIKRLPRGTPHNQMSCPIHNCFWRELKGGVVTGAYLVSFAKPSIELPRNVQTFIKNFDLGKYPELVIGNKKRT